MGSCPCTGNRHAEQLDSGDIRLPHRAARVLEGYTCLGRQIDVVETSRGSTCRLQLLLDHRDARSQIFRRTPSTGCWPTSRDARDRGARAIFLVGDNITLDVRRFAALYAQAIIGAGLHHLDYGPGDDVVSCTAWRRWPR